jgi:hypothetical protein
MLINFSWYANRRSSSRSLDTPAVVSTLSDEMRAEGDRIIVVTKVDGKAVMENAYGDRTQVPKV